MLVFILLSLPIALLGYVDIDHNQDVTIQINFAYMILRPLTFLYSILMFVVFVNLIKFFKKRREASINAEIEVFFGKKKKKNNDKKVAIFTIFLASALLI